MYRKTFQSLIHLFIFFIFLLINDQSKFIYNVRKKRLKCMYEVYVRITSLNKSLKQPSLIF